MAFSKTLYFAAIVPPLKVKEKILELKLEIKEKFEASHALKLPAHITLIPPVWLEKEKEQALIDNLKLVTEKIVPFPVELRDYGHFKQQVIFLNVVDHSPVKDLHQKLVKALIELLLRDEGKLHPHVTLATRDLSRQNFQKAWKEFENRTFRAEFEATSLMLFRHNGKTWDILEDFSFSEKENK